MAAQLPTLQQQIVLVNSMSQENGDRSMMKYMVACFRNNNLEIGGANLLLLQSKKEFLLGKIAGCLHSDGEKCKQCLPN